MPDTPNPNPPWRALGAALAPWLHVRGLEQVDLATAIGKSTTVVSRYLRGERRPSRPTLDAIVRALDLPATEAHLVYRLADFAPPIAQPTAEEAREITAHLLNPWLTAGPPATLLVDVFWTVWEANDAFWRAFTTHGGPLGPCDLIDLLLEPAFGLREALRSLTSDDQIEAFIDGMLFGLAAAHGDAAYEPWYREIAARVRARPRARAYLDAHRPRISLRSEEVTRLRSFRLLDGGRVTIHAHPLRRDPRFVLILFLPADLAAARAIEGRASPP